MTLQLFDLAGADDDLRFSPYCTRAKLALKHKGLDFETLPWQFTETDRIAGRGQGRVPILIDGEDWIDDSWRIALHLEKKFPNRPALFSAEMPRTAARFVNSWADLSLTPAIRPLVLNDVFAICHEKDKAHFRRTREAMLGMKLEEYGTDRVVAQAGLDAALAPVEQHLMSADWISGTTAAYADYIVAGCLQWLNVAHGDACLGNLPRTRDWFERVGALHGNYMANAPKAA